MQEAVDELAVLAVAGVGEGGHRGEGGRGKGQSRQEFAHGPILGLCE